MRCEQTDEYDTSPSVVPLTRGDDDDVETTRVFAFIMIATVTALRRKNL